LRGTSPISTDLAQSIEAVARRSSLGADVSFHAGGTAVDVPISDHRDIHYIVQEAITNAVTHGRASKISVELTGDTNGVQIRIEDNGVGWSGASEEVRSASGGVGLQSMRERAQRVGGRMEISSERNLPTTVTLFVPAKEASS
jgi:signal transduction histidine kinase